MPVLKNLSYFWVVYKIKLTFNCLLCVESSSCFILVVFVNYENFLTMKISQITEHVSEHVYNNLGYPFSHLNTSLPTPQGPSLLGSILISKGWHRFCLCLESQCWTKGWYSREDLLFLVYNYLLSRLLATSCSHHILYMYTSVPWTELYKDKMKICYHWSISSHGTKWQACQVLPASLTINKSKPF